MTFADGRNVRAGYREAASAIGFYACWSLVVLLGAVGRLTRWALREGFWRPRLSLAVVMSSLLAWWTTPLGGGIALLTAMLGMLGWQVNRFGRASDSASGLVPVGPILFTLSRQAWRAWRLKRRWRDLGAEFIKVQHGLTRDPPRLRECRLESRVRTTFAVNVSNAKQHIVDDLQGKMPLLAQTLRLHSCAIEPVRGRPGLARLTCYSGSRLEERQPLAMLPEPMPGYAFFGLGEDEQPAGIRLDLSALFVGESRSGKSTSMWACVLSALEQQELDKGWPVEFWVVDLALTEFADIKPLVADDRPQFNTDAFGGFRYATTQKQANAMLRMLDEEQARRAALMLNHGETYGRRKLEPTEELPWIILIVDEQLRVMDKTGGRDAAKDGNEAEGGTKRVLTQYAKFGITSWAGTQASKIEVLTSVRDWYHQRVAFSTSTTQMTDCALGTGAAAAGAICHQFSPHRDAGRGFMKRDGYAGYFPFRGVWVDDDATQQIGRGEIPDELLVSRGQPTSRVSRLDAEPGAVYLMFDADGVLLYVGKTKDARPSDRWLDHLGGTDKQRWSPEVRRVIVEAEDPATGRPYTHRDAVLQERRYVREGYRGSPPPKYNNIRFVTVTAYEQELADTDAR